MKSHRPEIALLMLVILVSIGGFWKLFMGPDAEPGGVHCLHLLTSLLWLALLLVQLVKALEPGHPARTLVFLRQTHPALTASTETMP